MFLLDPVLAVARLANFSSGLIFAVDPVNGRIRPTLNARRPRGRGDVQLVLVVARPAQFSSGLIFAVLPLTGRIRPALHARRTRSRGDVQLVLVEARLAHFSSGIILAVEPHAGRIRPALHARCPRGRFDGQLLRRIWNSNDVSRDETACAGSHHAYEVAWLHTHTEREREMRTSCLLHGPQYHASFLSLDLVIWLVFSPSLPQPEHLPRLAASCEKEHRGYWGQDVTTQRL